MANTHVLPDELDVEVDFFGQLPGFHIYTQISFCYPTTPAVHRSHLVQVLETGLQRLTEAFPWCAGKVVAEPTKPGYPSVCKIRRHLPTPLLVVKDLTHDPSAPTMDSLRAAKFPFRMLDENIIAPRNTIPGTSGEPVSDVFPVFIVQANFINGGLILTINAAHNVMDMVGQGQVIRLFSKACRGEPFTPADLKSGVLDIKVPTLDSLSDAMQKVEHQLRKDVDTTRSDVPGVEKVADPADSPQPLAPPKAPVWTYFNFTAASQQTLKSRAATSLPPTCSFISTDDALSAFIWQAVARARLPRTSAPEKVTFGRAVDVRTALGISSTYMAIIQNMVYTSLPSFDTLASSPLGAVAADLRAVLNPEEMKTNTYALATCIRRERETPDSGVHVDVGARMRLDRDLMLSSWAKVQCYDLDFGLGLGEVECVRRPQFIGVEGLMYLMPRTREGDIAFAVCLSEEDMGRLIEDEVFREFAEYIP